MNLSKTILLTSGAVLVATFFLVSTNDNTHQQPLISKSTLDKPTQTLPTPSQSPTLLAKNEVIVSEVVAQQSEVSSEKSVLAPDEPITEEQQREELQAFQKSLKLKDTKRTAHPVNEDFINEDIDYDWAYEHEQHIHQVVNSDQKHGFSIQNLQCRSTKCELELTATPENSMYLAAMFAQTIGQQPWHDKKASVSFDPTVIGNTIKVEIGRDENSIKLF